MKKYIVLCFFLSFSTHLFADWVFIDKGLTNGYSFYFDPSTIKRGVIASGWVLTDFKEPIDGARSLISLVEAECRGVRIRRMHSALYSGQMRSGRLLLSADSSQRWEYVLPDSVDEKIYYVLCGKRP